MLTERSWWKITDSGIKYNSILFELLIDNQKEAYLLNDTYHASIPANQVRIIVAVFRYFDVV
jgi:hypothetical protein